jgi:FSR family fosmidomycin resistance protein-like MFS transporter
VVLRHVVILSFLTFLVILLQGRGYGYLAGSLSLVGFLLVSAPAGLLGGHLSDRLGRWSVTIWSLWLGFSALLGFLMTRDALSLALLLLGGGLLSASNPVIVAHAQELLPQRSSTASALVMGFAWGVGGLLISAVGALGDAWGLERALGLATLMAFSLTVGLTLVGRRLGLHLHHSRAASTLPEG